jgi:hypothetical protein
VCVFFFLGRLYLMKFFFFLHMSVEEEGGGFEPVTSTLLGVITAN